MKKNLLWSNIKEIIITFSAFLGVVVGIMFFFGNIYYTSYFKTLNIPVSFVEFSANEYILGGSAYFVMAVVFGVVVIAIFALSRLIFASLRQRWQASYLVKVIGYIGSLSSNELDDEQAKIVDQINRLLLNSTEFMAVVALFVTTMLFISVQAETLGVKNALSFLLTETPEVSVFAVENVFDYDNSALRVTRTINGYQYDGLRFIGEVNGYLFFYDSVDPATCRPQQVYVIRATKIMSLQKYYPIDKIDCPN
jgi:hypothetical protein